MDFIEFPKDFPESERAKICKMLLDKDQEISKLYKEIVSLEHKLGKYSGSLTYGESEKLKTQMAILQFTSDSINRELNKLNLKMVQFYPPNSPNVYEIKIEKDKSLFQLLTFKISKFLKSLVFIEIKFKKNNE
jgi:hypothetical protein